jgi:hypothetical protein
MRGEKEMKQLQMPDMKLNKELSNYNRMKGLAE